MLKYLLNQIEFDRNITETIPQRKKIKELSIATQMLAYLHNSLDHEFYNQSVTLTKSSELIVYQLNQKQMHKITSYKDSIGYPRPVMVSWEKIAQNSGCFNIMWGMGMFLDGREGWKSQGAANMTRLD